MLVSFSHSFCKCHYGCWACEAKDVELTLAFKDLKFSR